MLHTALYHIDGPVAIRYPRGSTGGEEMRKNFTALEPGKGRMLKEGTGPVILTLGTMAATALEAGRLLENEGISVEIADMRFLKPLDTALIDRLSASATHIVTLEENSIIGGFGSAVADHLSEASKKTRLLRIGLPDAFVTHGSMTDLYRETGLDAPAVAEKIRLFYTGRES